MSRVGLKIAGRDYEVACLDGQEAQLTRMGRMVAERAAALAKTVGPVSDARLLLLTALTLADELAEARQALETAGQNAAGRDAALAAALTRLAERLEAVAVRDGEA